MLKVFIISEIGFFSVIANFGSKILGGVKKADQQVAPALHKVLSTISGPIGMIHPAFEGALGAEANLACAVDSSKRGNSSGGMISNEEYQLFIDNSNAQIYAANNQIVDEMASDYELKIELNVSAGGDFAFSDESGTVWMNDQNWYNSGDIVPDQVTPVSDGTPLSDGTATAGISTEYSLGDHVHLLNVTTTTPISDSASGSVGTTNNYARNDHSHHLNIITSIPPQDSASGSVGTTNYYARNYHSHPINVQTNTSNIPIVNDVGINGTSPNYARQDHVHPQQLTYDGNITTTKFIKTGGLTTEVLCANGVTTTLDDKLSRTYSSVPNYTVNGIVDLQVQNYVLNAGTPTSFAGVTSGNRQINPTATSYDDSLRISKTDPDTGNSSILLGCNRTSNIGAVVGQWTIFTPPSSAITNPQGLIIAVASQASDNTGGSQISADGKALTFNGRTP
ncbi:MAG: hypothetical protein EZS28_013842 [Streblomastix strix]|uniref:Uncharacterized protein n=1 Tax=Streblomastix strix TaxID=222440 RepID=A0A5J4W8B6_9EUKA|nr:MAG: hypothetical protein EZS28_013842 [Streblomastix strix]